MSSLLSSSRTLTRDLALKYLYPRGIFNWQSFEFPSTAPAAPGAQPSLVVLCLWNRPSHFRTLLENFAAQDTQNGLVIGLWNNDFAGRRHYEEELRRAQTHLENSAIRSVFLVNSHINTGGMGRFYLARKLGHRLKSPTVIYIDDDQVVRPEFVRTAESQARSRTLSSWWGHEIYENDYWNRRRTLPGEACDYAGTGGMIMDTALLNERALYRDLPRRFWFLEDIWLNHVALLNDYELRTLEAEISFVLDETNQGHALQDLKPEFYRQLAMLRTH